MSKELILQDHDALLREWYRDKEKQMQFIAATLG
jgi:hypothetical protein